MSPLRPHRGTVLALAALIAAALAASTAVGEPDGRSEYVVLSWNDLGMHCMNQWHVNLSILPPYNNLYAQVILVGDPVTPPQVLTGGVTLEYSIPGNTYSVGKTDFWDYALPLFGVTLPPNIGLTGKGLTGEMDPAGDHFTAEGIPVTPFPDATPTVEDPYQQAWIVARDPGGAVLAESRPVIPVSVEIHCLGSGCHSSETGILQGHPAEGGFNPNATPILCAGCHADPALGTTGIPDARYFSFQMHDRHKFLDQTMPGIDGCYRCHPGPETSCLRGTMATNFGMVCQDCHGNMDTVSRSIEQGRTPWLDEPSCGGCHGSAYSEPQGQLFRLSRGHGGVFCSGCHGSPHAIFPSREPRDNANNVALQGHAGTLSDCTVCHGHVPAGPGPHAGAVAVAEEVLDAPHQLAISPSPVRAACTIEIASPGTGSGRLLIFDAQGRTVRMLDTTSAGPDRRRATWDGRNRQGRRLPAGAYYVRWEAGAESAAARLVLVD